MAGTIMLGADAPKRDYSHYHKVLPPGATHIDVYRVCDLFEVTDQCIGHAVKKLLVPGRRGAGKDMITDVQEAIDSLERWKKMRLEELAPEPMNSDGRAILQAALLLLERPEFERVEMAHGTRISRSEYVKLLREYMGSPS